MSEFPWRGAARPPSPDILTLAAERLDCEEAALRAVWQVEADNRYFLPDGSLVRRFEPHKMPGATMTWRESRRLPAAERERLFLAAWRESPHAALDATSWGAPQIMGFNHLLCGFASAEEMVRRMADEADAQVWAFVEFCLHRKVGGVSLASMLRAHDWQAFAAAYNGNGQPDVYAARIEAAYRRASGQRSPVVLRLGDTGPAVKRLQRALGIVEDGIFGPETERAVKEFQAVHGLRIDGIVGARTWAALAERAAAKPPRQPEPLDKHLPAIERTAATATAVAGGLEMLRRVLPATAYEVGVYALAGMALITATVFWVRWMRARL